MKFIDEIHGEVVMGNQLTSYKRLGFLSLADCYLRDNYLVVSLSQESLPSSSFWFICCLLFKILEIFIPFEFKSNEIENYFAAGMSGISRGG